MKLGRPSVSIMMVGILWGLLLPAKTLIPAVILYQRFVTLCFLMPLIWWLTCFLFVSFIEVRSSRTWVSFENVTMANRSSLLSVCRIVHAACLVRSRMLRPLSSGFELSPLLYTGVGVGAGAGAHMLPEMSMTSTMSQGMCMTSLAGCSGGVIDTMGPSRSETEWIVKAAVSALTRYGRDFSSS
jgi:hypothetical protein